MELNQRPTFFIYTLMVLVVFLLVLSGSQLSAKTLKPPVPIKFTLDAPGYVTLVVEKPNGVRVRNLISDTWFPAGENTIWWDGLDDLGRDIDAANHGVYRIPAHFVEPGNYCVRGLVHGEISPIYEFSPYSTGNPPWTTLDHTGGWLANHSPPMAALFVPAKQSPAGKPVVMLGCYVTEGPDGLAWVDLDGNKLGGKKWVGGNWTAAPYLARDAGEKAIEEHRVYVASVWETGKKTGILELRITALTSDKDKSIIKHVIGTIGEVPKKEKDSSRAAEIGGLAVRNGILVASLPLKNKLIFVDAKEGKVIGNISLPNPKGLAFDHEGHLMALSENKLVQYEFFEEIDKISSPKTIIGGLSAPSSLTLDDEGNFYVSDRGNSHQVKVFTPKGKFIHSIGIPGVPKAGLYDPLHMNNPAGLAIDSNQHLWVTEQDYLPKRVSVWTLKGEFIKAFYGPGKYGGGGTLDPQDKTKFYYSDEGRGAMEFELDWDKGTSQLKNVYYRPSEDDLEMAFRSAAPETPIYFNGKRYFANCYNSSPTNGHSTAFLFAEDSGTVKPVAAMGDASTWERLKTEEFRKYLPEGVNLNSRKPTHQSFFIWCDLDGNSKVQPSEVQFMKGSASGVTIMNDLSFCIARIDNQALKYSPVEITTNGIPYYDIDKRQVLAKGVLPRGSSGGNQVLSDNNGWTVVSLGIEPFDKFSITGVKDGVPMWSYPNLWPGLHASHRAPKPDHPGQLIGPTRLLGGFIETENYDVGKLWAINGNHGNMYLFTIDGLFVATIFEDMRVGERWRMPNLNRGAELKGITLSDENFWPTIAKTSDGNTYLVDGRRSAIVRLDGVENIQRLPEISISLSTADIEKSRAYLLENESIRQSEFKNKKLNIQLKKIAPVVDGKINEWESSEWAEIDKSGVKAYFNAKTKPYNITGALTISGDRLYLAYQTGDEYLLTNSGEMPLAPFKTGGALDLMLGTNPKVNPDRKDPVPGDLRLLVTMIKEKPLALLYRAVVKGTKDENKIPFSSPWRTITFDQVKDVSNMIELSGVEGNFELSIPLSELGINPKEGQTIKGDIGILRGDGDQTIARIYWSNKATGITADVPAEAMLTPQLWGSFTFVEDADFE